MNNVITNSKVAISDWISPNYEKKSISKERNITLYKWVNDEISNEEYYKNCPYGYECWSCSYCGKWKVDYEK